MKSNVIILKKKLHIIDRMSGPDLKFGNIESYDWSDSVLTVLFYADGISGITNKLVTPENGTLNKEFLNNLVGKLKEKLINSKYFNKHENIYIRNEESMDILDKYLRFAIFSFNVQAGIIKKPEDWQKKIKEAHQRINLLMMAKILPSSSLSDLKNIKFVINHTTATNLFNLLAVCFGLEDTLVTEINGLKSWHPFTNMGTFDNRLYSLFTNNAAMTALTVHGFLKDNQFKKALGSPDGQETPRCVCFLKTLEMFHIEGTKFTINNDTIHSKCSFFEKVQCVFFSAKKLCLYDYAAGLLNFDLENIHANIMKTLDERTFRFNIDKVEKTENFQSILFTQNLLYKNIDELNSMNSTRRLEAGFHEAINSAYNINRVKEKAPIFFNIRLKNNQLFFATGKLTTSPLIDLDYEKNSPMGILWNDMNDLMRKGKTDFIIKNVSAVLGDLLYFDNGNKVFSYNGEDAYEIDENEKIINNYIILQANEFIIGKSYILKTLDKDYKILENKINDLKERRKYDVIHVEVNDVNVYDAKSGKYKKIKEILNINDINSIIQYQSQDFVYF